MSDITPPKSPKVIAHRGASRAFPENTIAAFRGAAELGADWVELDVRRTADGHLVVHHDAVLAVDGRAIVELRADELPAHVPSLADALAASEHRAASGDAGRAGMGVNIEIKSDRDEPDFDPAYRVVDEVVALVHEVFDAARVLVTSFDPRCVARVREVDPSVPTGLLSFDLADAAPVIERAVRDGHRALNPWDPFVTAELMALTRAAGLEVNVWTVDDPERMAELVALGVDGIITNVPDVARAVVDGTGGLGAAGHG